MGGMDVSWLRVGCGNLGYVGLVGGRSVGLEKVRKGA